MSELTFEHAGRTYENFTTQAALAAGVPQAVIDTALSKIRREAIKTECRSRIYGIASAEAQMNINGAAALVSAKAPADRSAAENAFMEAFNLSVMWIMSMREAVETIDQNPALDLSDNENWPVCPPEVVALATQY